MTDTGNELSEILSGDPAPAATTGAETTTTDTSQLRDEHGKFASKANDTVTTETQALAPGGDQSAAALADTGMVPQQALHAARQKADAKDAENADLRRQLSELTGKVDVLSRQAPRQQPAQQQEQPKPKDFWDNPEDYVKSNLAPLEQAMQRQREGVSRMLAVSAHGAETVQAAYRSLAEALQTNPAATFEYRRIMAAEHPYDELVKWHKSTEALARVGSDPDAFVQAELAKMLADPAKQAEILQQIQQSAAQSTTNRSAPATKLPPTLSGLPGGTNAAAPGLGDDASRLAAALAR